jgi:hypothetical protein
VALVRQEQAGVEECKTSFQKYKSNRGYQQTIQMHKQAMTKTTLPFLIPVVCKNINTLSRQIKKPIHWQLWADSA